jgi:hypothetical protein
MGKSKFKKRKRSNVPTILGITLLVLMGGISFMGEGGITMLYGADTSTNIITKLQAIPSLGQGVNGALFDVTLTLPDRSKNIISGNELLFSVELTNVGNVPTEVDLTYIINRKDGGQMVFIEHEKGEVETQKQFLKRLQLHPLPPGRYILYTHMLYGESTATASEEFFVALN